MAMALRDRCNGICDGCACLACIRDNAGDGPEQKVEIENLQMRMMRDGR